MVLQPLLIALKGILQVKYEIKTNDDACFITFFTTLDLVWPKFCPNTTPTLRFFTGFQWNMLENSINNKSFNWNPVYSSETFLLKPLNITIFQPNLCKKRGSPWAMPKTENIFLEITKPAHELSKPFYLNKMFWLSYKCFTYYFVWCFYAKKCHFQP